MVRGRKRKACSADKNDELMAEFRRLRDETQPIHNNLMALTPLPLINHSDGQLLRELQLMRTEMKQIQKDVSDNLERIRLEMTEMKQNLEVVKNNQEELKNAVTANASNLDILKRKADSESVQIKEINQKVSKLKCVPTIKNQISGKWKSTNGSGHVISIQINDDKFNIGYNPNETNVYTFGVKDSNGFTLLEDGEKIVRFARNWKREFYLENGMLVLFDKESGKEDSKFTYTRI